MTQLNQNTATLQEILEAVNNLPDVNSGGSASKLPAVIDGTCTEITAEDLYGATSIKQYAFYASPLLESVILPRGVTEIGNRAFFASARLRYVKIPNTVNLLRDMAFGWCSGLECLDLTDYGASTTFPRMASSTTLEDVPESLEIRVPQGRKTELASMTNWSYYAGSIVEA